MSMYVDNFLFAANLIKLLNEVKKLLVNKYDMKDLRKVKTIIGWQIMRDIAAGTMKID